MAWCSDCLCMFCCGPCALERRYGSNKNCGCTLSPWTIFHVLCTDASALLSYGYWISRQEKNKTAIDENNKIIIVDSGPQEPSQVSCSDLCCVPCLYASERQRHLNELHKNKQKSAIELTTLHKDDNNENNEKRYPVTDQPHQNLLLKL